MPTSRRSSSSAASSPGRATAATEDHDTLADAAFVEAEADGAFAIAWEAHGLRYGLPADVDRAIANGHVAVANVSRGALPALRQRYANVAVVEITAEPEILAERLAGRGRESRGEVLARLARTVAVRPTGPASSRSTTAGRRRSPATGLSAIIRKAMAFADISGTV